MKKLCSVFRPEELSGCRILAFVSSEVVNSLLSQPSSFNDTGNCWVSVVLLCTSFLFVAAWWKGWDTDKPITEKRSNRHIHCLCDGLLFHQGCVCALELLLLACISFGCILDFPDSLLKGGVNDMVRTVSRVIPLLGRLFHGVFFSPYVQEYSFSDSSQQSCSSVLTAEDVTYLPYYSSFLQLHQSAELPAELGGELCLQASFPPWRTGSGWVGGWFLGLQLIWSGQIHSFRIVTHIISQQPYRYFLLSLAFLTDTFFLQRKLVCGRSVSVFGTAECRQ